VTGVNQTAGAILGLLPLLVLSVHGTEIACPLALPSSNRLSIRLYAFQDFVEMIGLQQVWDFEEKYWAPTPFPKGWVPADCDSL